MTTLKQALVEFSTAQRTKSSSVDEGYDNLLVSLCDDLERHGSRITQLSKELADAPNRYRGTLNSLIREQSNLDQSIKQLIGIGSPPTRVLLNRLSSQPQASVQARNVAG